ncbi:hypothetical protein Tsubulata_011668, partial [Turnera subulata]
MGGSRMGLGSSCGSGNLTSDGEYGSCDDLIEDRKRISTVVRDFPPGCDPPGRVLTQVTKNSAPLVFPDIMNDSEQKVVPRVVVKQEKPELTRKSGLQQKNFPDILHTKTLVKMEDVEMKAKVCPPRRRTSAIRDYPKGCGPKAQLIDREVDPSIAFTAGTLDDDIPAVSSVLLKKDEEDTWTDRHHKVVVASCDSNMSQLDGGGKQCKQEKTRLLVNILDGTPGKSSGTIQFQKSVPTNSGYPTDRRIVMGLMAGPDCPWRKSAGTLHDD